MRELRPGVWHWQSRHPGWDEQQWWPELVSSYGIQVGSDFLLFDPLRVPDELRDRATAVVLTAPYHERDARQLGLPVHSPSADTWQDWVKKFGADADRVRGMESDDLAWLRRGEGEGHFHGPGPWPFGIDAYAGREDNDLILWLPFIKAIITGDSLSDFGDGLDIQLGGRVPRGRQLEIGHVSNRSLGIDVRVAGPDDVPAIALLRALWTGVDRDAAFEARLSAWVFGEGERRTMWLAWTGSRAVGMASVFEYRRMPRPGRPDSRWGYLSNMFVIEEFRNRGVGSALLRAIVAVAEERAYARLVLSPSERAVPFYQRAGFVVPDQSAGWDRLLVRPAKSSPNWPWRAESDDLALGEAPQPGRPN